MPNTARSRRGKARRCLTRANKLHPSTERSQRELGLPDHAAACTGMHPQTCTARRSCEMKYSAQGAPKQAHTWDRQSPRPAQAPSLGDLSTFPAALLFGNKLFLWQGRGIDSSWCPIHCCKPRRAFCNSTNASLAVRPRPFFMA